MTESNEQRRLFADDKLFADEREEPQGCDLVLSPEDEAILCRVWDELARVEANALPEKEPK